VFLLLPNRAMNLSRIHDPRDMTNVVFVSAYFIARIED